MQDIRSRLQRLHIGYRLFIDMLPVFIQLYQRLHGYTVTFLLKILIIP